MSFVIKPDRPVAREIRRLAIRQLELAASDLRAEPSAEAPHEPLHEARRHLKKAKALLRLAGPALPGSAWRTRRQLRDAGRALAPLADADASVRLLGLLTARVSCTPGLEIDAALRPLLEARRDRLARAMSVSGGRAEAAAQIEAARARIEHWHLRRRGFRGVSGGLQRSVRRAQRASERAAARATGERYHAWRQRVKDLWLQVRLIDRRTGGHLAVVAARLEALDDVLGQYHDCTLLRGILTSRAARTRPREAAACLRLVRTYQQELRRQALALRADVHDASPAAFVAHVRRLWRAARVTGATAAPPSRVPWRDAA